DCFKKDIEIKKSVVKARVYASALGVYKLFVDGNSIEDFILAPGITDYRKRVQYQTYNVTEYFSTDVKNHRLEIFLGDGWYRGSSAAYGVTNVYGTETAVLLQLELVYSDGSREVVATDENWDWSNDGPIRFADLKDGEVYDANLKPSYDKKPKNAKIKHPIHLVASDNVYVKEQEVFTGKIIKKEDGVTVLDFGQNIAGYLSFKIKGKKGNKIHIFCTELTDEKGYADPTSMQETRPKEGWTTLKMLSKLLTNSFKGEADPTPHQEIDFICSGDWDSYKTSFAVFGFRYVQIEGDIDFDEKEFYAIALYSDMRQTGEFCCSDERVNQFVKNTLWSMKGNFLDIPTDCPTRERLGWTGDAQVFFDTGSYFMDVSAFFEKWMRDMEDAQYKDGLLPAVLPYEGVEQMYKSTGSSVGWADAVYLIPYGFYKRYGDTSVLIEHWPMMKRYGEFLKTHRGYKDKKQAKSCSHNDGIYEKGIHLGEWLEPVEFRDKVYGTQAKHPEECTAYLYYAMTILSEIAGILGETATVAEYAEIAQKAKAAYEAEFITEELFSTKREAKLVRPLTLGLITDEDKKKRAGEAWKKAGEDFDYRVGTGFLSTPFLLGTLTETGESDTAYKVLLNEKNPGWLYEVLKGSTTVWENWEGKDVNGKGSFNHYSPGSACQWLFDTVAGIRVTGENHFTIAPVPGNTLSSAGANYESIYGKVSCKWEKENGHINYHIFIPENCSATLRLTGMEEMELETGEYTYEI
nr:glycoside hydrolase family 78 protein [Lachnospiraceae bacterium]